MARFHRAVSRCSRGRASVSSRQAAAIAGCTKTVKLFYTGPAINAEMLVVMLEKHGINAQQAFVSSEPGDEDDLNREATVSVPEADYDRAWRLFYAEREDEL